MRMRFFSRVFPVLVLCLQLRAADTDSPTVSEVVPGPGSTVSLLDQVKITFSEPVTGLEVGDFLINDLPAQSLSGGSNVWTFFFGQPVAGLAQLRWDINHTVTDLSGNRLDEKALSAVWSYTVTDLISPTVLRTQPAAGATVAAVSEVQVWFTEDVSGVDAGDLLRNGVAAQSVSGTGVGPYLFRFPAAAPGQATFSWAAGNAIADLAPAHNPLVGSPWSLSVVPESLSAVVRINELMTDNLNGILDEDGATVDWVELVNAGTSPVSLLGWGLSDDGADPYKWVFPAVNLGAGQYLIVYASGKDRKPIAEGSRLHTNFRLGTGGGHVVLSRSDAPAVQADAVEYPEQRGDLAYGRGEATTFTYLATATPGTANAVGVVYRGFTLPPRASVASGFFDRAFQLNLSSPTPETTIYYTLDGSVPTRTSFLLSGAIPVEGTPARGVVTIRAKAFSPGLLPSTVTTLTYIFPEMVLSQPAAPAGFPTTWVSPGKNNTPGDYAMDPKVTTNAVYRPMILEGLKDLPTISLVTDEKLIFEPAQGVYVRRDSANRQPVHVEMIFPDGRPGFAIDAGFEIQGGSSPDDAGSDWKDKNLSMRLVFSGDFGNPKLKFPLYPNSPVDEFDTLILDSALNMVWNHMTDESQRYRGQYAREQFVNELMIRTTAQPPRGRFVHVYLNGLYWGMKNIHERAEEKWAASYFGGEPADYDVIKHTSTQVVAGNVKSYNEMVAAVSKSMANITNYVAALPHLDIDWFIDYMMVNIWAGNDDWDHHNWYAVRSRKPGSPGWRFISWDAEHVLKDVAADRLSINNSGAGSALLTSLRNSPEFRLRFADHVHKHFFNDGIFYVNQASPQWDPAHPEWNRPAALYMQVIDQIDPSIVCESARWGDVARPGQPYTRNVEWLRELQSLLFITNSSGNTTRYFPLRSSNVFLTFRRAGLYPTNSLPPIYRQHGGRVPAGFALFMTNQGPGTVYFTTDGNDPRVFRSGAVALSAQEYSDANPPLISRSMLIKARTLNGTNWSALNEAAFEAGSLGSPIRITEIMYNPVGGDAYEYVELQNTSSQEVDLNGWAMEGVSFSFVPGTRIAPGAFLVLASAVDTNAWKLRYPGVRIGGVFEGTLSNGGERLGISSPDGVFRDVVAYDDEGGWPTQADGGGASLELISTTAGASDPSHWTARVGSKGSPGLPTPSGGTSTVELSEILADNRGSVVHEGAASDFVELHNLTGSPVNLSGWVLSGRANGQRFLFPPGSQVPANGYLVVWMDTRTTSGLHAGFGLDLEGDGVFLDDATTNRVSAVVFGPQLPDRTTGLVGGNWVLAVPTPGTANSPVTMGGQTGLWINEVLAKHAGGQDDWIEIYNTHESNPVSLQGLYLRVGDSVARYELPGFVAPKGFVQLFANGGTGVRDLNLKLPSDGPEIVLFDASGAELQRLVYGGEPEGASFGSYPDGTVSRVNFVGNSTPGAPNASPALYSGPILSEIMARNESATALPGTPGLFPDWIELVNPGAAPVSLAGYVLELNQGTEGRFAFPSDITMASGAYLIVWCEKGLPASTNAGAVINAGFDLPGQGGVLTLRSPSGAVHSLSYGLQLVNQSIGVLPDGSGQWSLLSKPTRGSANSSGTTLGEVSSLALNEWMADPASGPDWIEIRNGSGLPVSLGNLGITDDLSQVGLVAVNRFGPLNFVPGSGHIKLVADGQRQDGEDHLSFQLDADGNALRLYRLSSAGAIEGVIDEVGFGAQATGVSQGRWPDGQPGIRSFPSSASPGLMNWLPTPTVRLSEVLAGATLPQTDFIELHNSGDVAADISSWWLSDDPEVPKKLRFAVPKTIAAHGYLVVNANEIEVAGSFGLFQQFSLSAAGETLVLSAADVNGNLTGYQDQITYGASGPNTSFIPLVGCADSRWVAAVAVTKGTTNAKPKFGPVVINEFRPNPIQDGLVDSDVEFVELHNAGSQPVNLGPSGNGTLFWRLEGDVRFRFPSGVQLSGGGYLILVPFDPQTNAAAAAHFRAHYGLGAGASLVGPYEGQLNRSGEALALVREVTTPEPGGVGIVPEVIDEFRSSLASPASESVSRRSFLSGALPTSWGLAVPTPGRANVAGSGVIDADQDGLPDDWEAAHGLSAVNAADAEADADGDGRSSREEFYQGTDPQVAADVVAPPVILSGPAAAIVQVGDTVQFGVTVSGTAPLVYRWFRNGALIPAASEATLVLPEVGPGHDGEYQVSVANPAGCVLSAVARLTVPIPPTILGQPQNQIVDPGKPASFSVNAVSVNLPLTFQWMFNGVEISGATSSTLQIPSAQLSDEGNYTVRVSDTAATLVSAPARLTVKVRPTLTQLVLPELQTVAIGSNATFTISASGSLPMTYRWRKVGTSTPLTNITLFSTSGVFTLKVSRTNDAGRYYVTITNLAGASIPVNSSTSILAVVRGPVITSQPQSLTVDAGGNATFSVVAEGDGPLSYQWLRNGRNIQGATGTSYGLTGVQDADAGTYSVSVSNAGATVLSDSARLFVVGAPTLGFELVGDSLHLSWPAVVGKTYRIETKASLSEGAWELVGTEIIANNPQGNLSVPVQLAETDRYFRLVLVGN